MALYVVAATAMELSGIIGEGLCLAQGQSAPVRIGNRDVTALVTGLGVVNAALTLGRALGQGHVDGVVCLGVAGSFDLERHPLGSVRLLDEEIWPEYGLLTSEWACADARLLGFPLGTTDQGEIWDRLELAPANALERLSLSRGPWTMAHGLTVSGICADAERAAARRESHDVALESMEGFALAYACALENVPFVELRAISNAVGARPPRNWDMPGALAALAQATEQLFRPHQP